MISKEEIFEARRKASKELDLFIKTSKDLVKDSKGVSREIIWDKNGKKGTLAYGNKEETTRVEPNPYDADLFVFDGAVRVDFDEGKSVTLKKRNRHLYIPKFTAFTVTSLAQCTAVLTLLEASIE